MKSLCCALLLVFSGLSVKAQLYLKPSLYLGVSKLSTSYTSTDPNWVFENKFGFSWSIGSDLNYQFNERFSLQGGVYLEQIGHYWGEHVEVKKADAQFPFAPSEPDPIRTYSNEFSGYLYFASLPVSMQVHLNNFTLGAGLQYSQRLIYLGRYRTYIRLNALEDIEWQASTESSYNLSCMLEAAYRFHPNWDIGLRFTRGLVDMQKGPWLDGISVRSTQIQLGLQYKFQLGKKE